MERELPFLGHLEELRKRIIISLAALIITTLICLPFSAHIFRILKLPMAGVVDKLAFFGPEEAFMIYMKVAFFAGFLAALPVIAYQCWAFAAPAIEDRLRRYTAHFVLLCSLAFLAGCSFAYFALLPNALRFLLGFALEDLEPVISADKYISFVIAITACSGIVFEMPVLSFLLTRAGIIDAGLLRRKFGWAVIMIALAAAVITPTTDIFNMLLMAVPMLALYEVSIWVSFLASKGRYGKD
ncbi:MAG: twin-arginine translocase subunit TatC [Candidatus Omnitrophota bacterium]